MSYQKDRDEFIGVIVDEINTIANQCRDAVGAKTPARKVLEGVHLARMILRNAATLQRHAVIACNRQTTPGENRNALRAENRLVEACGPWGIKPKLNGDPRGCVVKLVLPSGRWNGWGGAEDGYLVPTR